MYNRNTRYFSRAIYRATPDDTTTLYVVASLVPAGRPAEVEIPRSKTSPDKTK